MRRRLDQPRGPHRLRRPNPPRAESRLRGPGQPRTESRLWRLLVPALVAPALAVAGAALAGMAYCATEAQAHPLPSDVNEFTDADAPEPVPAGPPGPERFHSGFLPDGPLTTASPDDSGADAVKSGFGYGLRVERAPLPETRGPATMPIASESPANAAPPQPEFTPD